MKKRKIREYSYDPVNKKVYNISLSNEKINKVAILGIVSFVLIICGCFKEGIERSLLIALGIGIMTGTSAIGLFNVIKNDYRKGAIVSKTVFKFGSGIFLFFLVCIFLVNTNILINNVKDFIIGPVTLELRDCNVRIENRKNTSFLEYGHSYSVVVTSYKIYILEGNDALGKKWELELYPGSYDNYSLKDIKENVCIELWENSNVLKEIISVDAGSNNVE